MRKELLMYVNTMDRGEEFSIASVSSNRDFVIISTVAGKFTANVKELEDALAEIKAFNQQNNNVTEKQSSNYQEISYGEE